MADERNRQSGRKRGRRRGRQESAGESRPEEIKSTPPAADEPVEPESSAASGGGVRRSFLRRPRGEDRKRRKEPQRPPERAAAADVSPMDFWRGGQARSQRQRALPRGIGPRSLWRRITGFYFPPWVPVVGIIVIVFALLGLLFFTREATGAPRVADHWHAPYQFFVCGERQPNFPTWESGVHTHADGIIHIHPFAAYEEGTGSRLVKWFEYGGGELTRNSVRAPGKPRNEENTYRNGETCPDGREGEVQVFVNGQKLPDYTRYIPQDGDQVRIVFGPVEEVIQEEDRIIIPEEQATRTVEMEVRGNEGSTAFSPASVEVTAGETVKIVLKNAAEVSHGLRVSGVDGEYDTPDDFVATPAGEDPRESAGIIAAGQEGFVVVRFDAQGEVEFRDTTVQSATGKIIVRKAEEATPTPEAEPEEEVDVTLELGTGEMFYEPADLAVQARQKFRINIQNGGQFVHNVRLTGPDGEFDTEDDIVSPDVLPGEAKALVAQIDRAGTYKLRCDFHQTEHEGTLLVE